MPDITFPRILYSATEPTGHLFESQAEVDAAGGTWYLTPTEAADAAAQAAEAPPSSPASHQSDEGSTTPRSRR